MRFAACPSPELRPGRSNRHGLALSRPEGRLAGDPRSRSALAGFIDDLAVQVHEHGEERAVRSAARLGYYDFGFNRRRAEALRKILRTRGIIR